MSDPLRIPKLRMFEGGVFSACSPVVLTDQRLLGELTEHEADQFHLYAIVWRPRIRVVPDQCRADTETLFFSFTIDSPEGPVPWDAELTNVWQDADVTVSAEAPYTYFELHRAGSRVFRQHVGWWLSQMKFFAENTDQQPDLFDLEVLYVGQAYGAGGERTSRDRLTSHETLQAVYAKANAQAPHNEVGIVLLGMEAPIQMVRMMPLANVSPDMDEGMKQFEHLITAAPSFGQRLNFTEAALIRYFRPEFNEKFKDLFPSRSHTSYEDCFTLDLNSVGFTIDGRTLFGRLWSSAVTPAWLHMQTYFLHSSDERRDMFDFTT